MRYQTFTFEADFKVFEPGEKVRPATRSCIIPDGIYTVQEWYPPAKTLPIFGPLISLEGMSIRIDADQFLPIGDKVFRCMRCEQPIPIGRPRPLIYCSDECKEAPHAQDP